MRDRLGELALFREKREYYGINRQPVAALNRRTLWSVAQIWGSLTGGKRGRKVRLSNRFRKYRCASKQLRWTQFSSLTVFLQRPELLSYWDLTVFVEAPFNVTVARMSQRDGVSPPDLDAAENLRYVDGQRLYLQTCDPRNAAMLVFNNEDLRSPELALHERTHSLRRSPKIRTITECIVCRAIEEVGISGRFGTERVGEEDVPPAMMDDRNRQPGYASCRFFPLPAAMPYWREP